jgi:hypothetical protein
MPREIRGSSDPRRHARSAKTATTPPSFSFYARAALPIPFSASLSPLVPCAGLLRAVFEDVCGDRRARGEAQTQACQLSALMTPECTCACSRAVPLHSPSCLCRHAVGMSALMTPESIQEQVQRDNGAVLHEGGVRSTLAVRAGGVVVAQSGGQSGNLARS